MKQNTSEAFDFFWASEFAKRSYMTAGRRRHAAYVASLVSGDSVLDVGCGDGTLLKIIGAGIGIDYSAVSAGRVMALGFCTVQADARRLPLRSSSHRHVTCVEVLEHTPHPDLMAKELSRVLASGGELVVGVPDGEKDTWDGHINRFSSADIARLFYPLMVYECHAIKSDLIIVLVKK